MKKTLILAALLGVPLLQTLADDSVEMATVKEGKPFTIHGDKLEPITTNLKFCSEIEISTNGTFHVGTGKERTIQEDQIVRSDGWLANPDGSIAPVFDHIAMKAGKVILVKDGQAEELTAPTKFPSNLQVSANGDCVYPSGSRSRLVDGQLFRLDGTAIPAKDTVTLKNGTVKVQKDGKLISIRPPQIMGLNDGSRVQADGTITHRDGTVTKLQEGQTIFVEGRLIKR